MQILESIKDNFVDIFYLRECSLGFYENKCKLSAEGSKVCSICKKKLVNNNLEIENKSRNFKNISKCFAVVEYKNYIKDLVLELKWKKPERAELFAELMAEFYKKNLFDYQFDLIVPVPGFITQGRDWSPSILLAQYLSKFLKIPVKIDLLQKTKKTTLHKYNLKGRKQNLQDAYKISDQENFSFQKILLIDDLVASGSTLEYCAGLIKILNTNIEVFALVFAASFFD